MSRAYEYSHIVAFEETNVVGNVYYANHIRWQGRCRELFLRDHAPEILADLAQGLVLVTTRVSCDYFSELYAFDQVIVRMRAGNVTQSRVTMLFDYVRVTDIQEEIVAQGQQQVACLRKKGEEYVAIPVPEVLRQALIQYSD